MTNSHTYIVYEVATKKVVSTHVCTGKWMDDMKNSEGTLAWINRTHPMHQDLLKELVFRDPKIS